MQAGKPKEGQQTGCKCNATPEEQGVTEIMAPKLGAKGSYFGDSPL
jgi:hypothetical protein